jgi:Cytochrome P460
MSRFSLCVVGFVVVIPLGCSGPVQPDDVEVAPTQGQTEQGNQVGGTAQFNERLLEIGDSYESYGRIDTTLRWGVTFCSDAGLTGAASPRFSSSSDSATHGQKLYSLFVKDRPRSLLAGNSYVRRNEPNPVGQVLVKEAWTPEEVKDDHESAEPVIRKVKVHDGDKLVEEVDSFLPYARKDGRLYRATRKSALFIMYKVDPKTPDTDEGWVYGTVSADGKQVTSAGRVESCMRCHQKAPHDRLFGLPKE